MERGADGRVVRPVDQEGWVDNHGNRIAAWSGSTFFAGESLGLAGKSRLAKIAVYPQVGVARAESGDWFVLMKDTPTGKLYATGIDYNTQSDARAAVEQEVKEMGMRTVAA